MDIKYFKVPQPLNTMGESECNLFRELVSTKRLRHFPTQEYPIQTSLKINLLFTECIVR